MSKHVPAEPSLGLKWALEEAAVTLSAWCGQMSQGFAQSALETEPSDSSTILANLPKSYIAAISQVARILHMMHVVCITLC